MQTSTLSFSQQLIRNVLANAGTTGSAVKAASAAGGVGSLIERADNLAAACKQASLEIDNPSDPEEIARHQMIEEAFKRADSMIPNPPSATAQPPLGKGPGTMPTVGTTQQKQVTHFDAAGGKPQLPAAGISAKGQIPQVGMPTDRQKQVFDAAGNTPIIPASTGAPATQGGGGGGGVVTAIKNAPAKLMEKIKALAKMAADTPTPGGPGQSGAAAIVPAGAGVTVPKTEPRANLVTRISATQHPASSISNEELRALNLREGAALFPQTASRTIEQGRVPSGYFSTQGPIKAANALMPVLHAAGRGAVAGGAVGGALGVGKGIYDEYNAAPEDQQGYLRRAGISGLQGAAGGAVLGGIGNAARQGINQYRAPAAGTPDVAAVIAPSAAVAPPVAIPAPVAPPTVGNNGWDDYLKTASDDQLNSKLSALKASLKKHEDKETPEDEKKESKDFQKVEAALGTEQHKPSGEKKDAPKKDEAKKDEAKKDNAKQAADYLRLIAGGRAA